MGGGGGRCGGGQRWGLGWGGRGRYLSATGHQAEIRDYLGFASVITTRGLVVLSVLSCLVGVLCISYTAHETGFTDVMLGVLHGRAMHDCGMAETASAAKASKAGASQKRD